MFFALNLLLSTCCGSENIRYAYNQVGEEILELGKFAVVSVNNGAKVIFAPILITQIIDSRQPLTNSGKIFRFVLAPRRE